MKILLTGSQLQAISEFCLDVAKGLMLAAILGQGIAGSELVLLKSLGSLTLLIFSVLFLYTGVSLRRKK